MAVGTTNVFGHEMDAAKLRGAPLGWYFPLFFIIQGLMPGGFAIAVAATQKDLVTQLAIRGGGAVLSALILGFLARSALRARARVAHFEEAKRGRRAQAQVLGVEYLGQAGTVKSGGSRRSYSRLRVHVRAWFEDGIPFELNDEARYSMTERIRLEMLPVVTLSLHPSGQGPFLIHPESLMPQLPPPGPRAPQGPQVRIQPTSGANRSW